MDEEYRSRSRIIMTISDRTPEEIAVELSQLVRELVAAGRNDLLLRSIGVSVLEELRIEAAKSRLSRLLVSKDYRIILVDYDNKEVEMTPVHKAVYLLFLNHPEGIEFKRLSEYRDELLQYYMATAKLMDKQTITESVDMLVNPLNNSINEKCSRIRAAFMPEVDATLLEQYIITGKSGEVKKILLSRDLVVWE